jgi:beta-N-acetylhexosaminidase
MDDNRIIYHMGADIAKQLRMMGVHINFAPVIDINNNPDNPVINTRAFGENREAVTQKGLAYMMGLQDNGIIACAKHFPGHGDTDTDSHYDLPLLKHNFSRIDSLELYPFRKLIQSGVESIMIAHMEVPSLDPKTKTASSLSYDIVTKLLQNDLGFNGLVITDALNMKGVSDYHKPVDLNYLALKAGNDIILFPSDVKASISRIEREVKRGRFPIEEIERRCRKVIEAKYRVGLDKYQKIDTSALVQRLNQTSSEYLIRQIAEQAITVLNNRNSIFPLRGLDTLSVAYIEIGTGNGSPFLEQLELYAPITKYTVDALADEITLSDLYYFTASHNVVIVGYHSITSNPRRDFGVTSQMAHFIERISRRNNTILTLFGSPYSLSRLINPELLDGLIVSYDNSPITQSVTAQLIFGGATVNGRLPVTASSLYKQDYGFNSGEKIRFKYSIPEELNLKARYFTKIDSIAYDAIRNNATPCMQILVAQKGVVVYNKSFGKYGYNDFDFDVNHKSLYDVASLTKISSTLPLVMDLYSKGKMSLNDSLGKYLTIPDTSKYNSILISDILLHQAGLVAWIPFYQRTMASLWPKQPVISQKFSEQYPYQLGRNRYMSRHAFPSRKFYRNSYSFEFPHEVAMGMYAIENMSDSIFNWIYKAPLNKPGKYLYSDLGHILLFRAIGNILNSPQEEYLEKHFYKKLGMQNTLFNPLRQFDFDRIVPTENDVHFRKQLIWGYVHDPAAAMMGGMAGHAGLFSTANDMAKLMQLFLNNGEYGGVRYFPSSTLDLFTSCLNCKNGIRRGLGFDKPEPDPKKPTPVSRKATSLSYGHSGFTGVLVWVDPAYELVYVFISNRIFPETENTRLVNMDVRTKIQDVVYDAVIDVSY